jgi:hypothetical protein
MLVMPVTAIGVYAPVAIWGWKVQTNWLLYVITMPLGFFLLVRSLWVLCRLPGVSKPEG